MINGILIIDKPQDYTSFDVIAILRKKFNQKKIGHMGTLDPMATGVLPILLGSAAKFQIYAPENIKEYICEIQFGTETDTWDIWGKIINQTNSNIKINNLENILHKFIGDIKQVPPMYSAIKQNGVKLCNLARQGIEIERPARNIKIHNINIMNFDAENQVAVLKILCSSGTYIRSLCHDFGQELNTCACMKNLKRTLSNSFDISQSVSLDNIKNLDLQEIINNHVLCTDKLFEHFEKINFNPEQLYSFKHGASIKFRDFDNYKNNILRVYFENVFAGLVQIDRDNNILRYLKAV